MPAEAQPIHHRPVWNTGHIIGPTPPLKPRHICVPRQDLPGGRGWPPVECSLATSRPSVLKISQLTISLLHAAAAQQEAFFAALSLNG